MTEEQTTETTEEQDLGHSVPPEPEQEQEQAEEDTFPREYVQKLRDENAKFRQRAQRSDELAHRLHTALVAADGRLADPTDLEFTEEHLEDAESLSEAIGELLRSKPHLAARRPRGDVGQGASGGSGGNVDLAGLLRAGAS
ncbi:hypothetical protein [Nesterenkonia sphaerica]|uniref:Uncharacterized protein n=1 Tax=Nesterenkonia sphaerica TaxID=1804988 RepID=A0A5R9ABL2_9MICC|nr:hypothetical protein [Nesterenkonia sphaerica]TLP75514.1 hypothetical protein FEF27_07610 [Nesterenkonia sphaerica]